MEIFLKKVFGQLAQKTKGNLFLKIYWIFCFKESTSKIAQISKSKEK